MLNISVGSSSILVRFHLIDEKWMTYQSLRPAAQHLSPICHIWILVLDHSVLGKLLLSYVSSEFVFWYFLESFGNRLCFRRTRRVGIFIGMMLYQDQLCAEKLV